jgi:hypothetical protein
MVGTLHQNFGEIIVDERPEAVAPGAGILNCGMSQKMIPVEECFAEWRKDPEYVKAYEALEDEFSLAAAVIERAHVPAKRKRR